MDYIEAFNKKLRHDEKMKVEYIFLLGDVIGNRVAHVVGGENELIQPWDIVPDLFHEERESAEAIKQERILREMSESRRIYAQTYNKIHKKGGDEE